MRTVADDAIELAETQKFARTNRSDLEGQTWLLVDCIDVLIHIFSDDARRYYDLDNLWGDAKKVDWAPK
jgi:ribosome-associated protein